MKRLLLTACVAAALGCSGSQGVARLELDPPAVGFGEVAVGQASAPRLLTVLNAGEGASGALQVTVPASFRATMDGCSGTTLARAQGCTLELVFEPAAVGLRSAVLRVEAAPGGETLAELVGNGLEPGVTRHALTVIPAGAGQGTVTGDGIDCGTDCTEDVPAGDVVLLTAAPAAGSTFVEFRGCDSTLGLACTVTMHTPRNVVAEFAVAASSYPLTVARAGTGTGTVTGQGIDCGADCAETLPAGTSVVLTASPAVGSTFSGFAGCDAVSGASCTVALTGPRTVTATFDQAASTSTLTVQKAGSGAGTVSGPGVSCGADCAEALPTGTVVTLTAAAGASSSFGGFMGCDSVSGTTCTLTLSGNRTVTATFTLTTTTHTLTVQKQGAGSGTVTGQGIACGMDCSEVLPAGTGVTLTAAPAMGSTFASWAGCDTASGPTCTLTLTANRTVTATFTPAVTSYALVVQKAGTGSGTVSGTGIACGADCGETLPAGTPVTLTATASADSSFVSFTGCDATSSATCTLTMNANRTVTATFNAAPPAAPGDLTAQALSSSSIRLSWTDNATTETAFEVQRGGRVFVTVATLPANTTTWTDTGLTAGTEYSYRVRATNAVGPSGYSNTATATPPTAQVCTPGATRCIAGNVGSLETCNGAGTAWTTAACSFGKLCTRSACRTVCGLTATPAAPSVCFVPNNDGVNNGWAALWTDSRLSTTYTVGGAYSSGTTPASVSLDTTQTWPYEWGNIGSSGAAYVQFKLNQFGTTTRTTKLVYRAKRAGILNQNLNQFTFGAFNGGTMIGNLLAFTVPYSWDTFEISVGPPYSANYSYTGGWNANLLGITGDGFGGTIDILEVNWVMLQVQ